MGLDNGIYLKNFKILENEDYPYFVDKEWEWEGNTTYSYDICYWRKCWSIRRTIFYELELDREKSEFNLTKEEVNLIANILFSYMDKDYYYEEGNQNFWTYEEMIERLGHEVAILKWLAGYLDNHPEIEVIFYDSY